MISPSKKILQIGLIGLIGQMPHALRAHPLQAEPINHAYVFNFDQFNLPEDPDEHVVTQTQACA